MLLIEKTNEGVRSYESDRCVDQHDTYVTRTPSLNPSDWLDLQQWCVPAEGAALSLQPPAYA